MIKAPFNPVTGLGLGISYSSLNQIGGVFPQNGLGQASVKFYVNMVNGNLIVKDRMSKLQEMNGDLEIGYFYNSQAATTQTAWQLNIKSLTQLPSVNPPVGQTAVLQEEDGHLTTYTLSTSNGSPIYIAPGLGDGTPYIYYDADNTRWKWYHPKTQITEYYNLQGQLTGRLDALGRATNYYYDRNGQLSSITGPTGNTYVISRNGPNVGIYEVIGGQQKLLQFYTFDSLGRLTQSQVSLDGTTTNFYTTTYVYGPSGNNINYINQTDGTSLALLYQPNTLGISQVSRFRLGTDVTYALTYPNANQPNQAMIQDGYFSQTTLQMDQNGHTTQVKQQTGFNVLQSEIDITNYTYTSSGQLNTMTNPDGGQTSYFYDPGFGLMTQKNDPSGQITQYNYYNATGPNNPIWYNSKTQTLVTPTGNQLLKTFYVYDPNINNSGFPFLRFEISPQGKVKEYRANQQGNIDTVREYLNGTFDTSATPPNLSISLQQMLDWVDEQNVQQVSLTKFDYNYRGQVTLTQRYANVDAEGNGIQDAFMYQEVDNWDEFGNLLQKEVQQTSSTQATTTQRFDGLQRLTAVVDPLCNKTSNNYVSQNNTTQVQVTYPNGCQDVKTLGTDGLALTDSSTAQSNGQNQTRLTTYARDTAGRPVRTTLPDNNLLYTFYDRQNRLGFKVTPLGIVTEYDYDRIHRYKKTTTYANPINATSFYSPTQPGLLPVASMVQNLLVCDPLNDRSSYEFYDASGRLACQVDSGSYITQFYYDNLNRQTAKVVFSTQLTAAQIAQLQNAQPLNLTPDFTKDRGTQYFYNNDNYKIGEINSAGYVIEYVRDAAGRVIQKIQYATTVPLDLATTNFNRPAKTSDDANTYYILDARGQRLAEVDADSYLTTHTYLPCGLKQQSYRYANPIDVSWFTNPTVMPPLPAQNSEDQTTVYTYDLLSRPTEIDGPMQQASIKQYDVMGNVILNQIQDLANPNNVAPDYQRNTQAQYDGWNQATTEANPFVGLLIAQVQANQNLTPEQKQQQILAIWQTQSTRHTYDATGLKLYSIDSLNNKTYYYYDNDRRLVITVDATGCVTENTLNNFGEPTLKRGYAARLSAQQLATLIGGFISATFRTYLNSLQVSFDQVTQKTVDQRGLVTQITDPENYVTINTYNAFKQIETENLSVSSTQPSLLISHQYEPRGLETQTQKTAGNLVTVTSQVFANLYGERTLFTDERGTIFQTNYDPLGQITSQIRAYSTATQATTTFKNDAFNRVLLETDSLGEQTQHIYNQTNRTHTILYPDPNVKKTITLNVFNQKQQEADALGNTQSWIHAADGQINIYTDPLKSTTIDAYDLLGRRASHTDQNNILTNYTYNGSNQLTQKIYDVKGLNLITTYIPDAFGNASILDPRSVLTANTFDRRNLLTQSVIDPNLGSYTGLNLTTTNTYNGQKTLSGKTVGDNTTLNQYQEAYPLDGLNRPTGKVIDPITPTNPQALNITTADTLDVSGLVVAEADPNGNVTYTFYDNLKRKRFAVDPLGGVVEWNYDTENRTSYERHYQQAIDPTQLSNQTTLSMLMSLVTANNQLDTVEWYFYDQAGHERFKIKNFGNDDSDVNIGAVTTKNYDAAYRLISTTCYATPIDITNITTFTTSSLVTLMQDNVDSTNDRTTYNILDAKGQACFIIDAVGVVTYQIFDNKGQIITKTIFANPVVNPAQIAQLPVSQVLAQITPDPVNDQTTYQVFDSRGKPQFVVDPEGNVYRYDHDENANLVKQYQLSKSITPPSDYTSLVTLLDSLATDPSIDAITQRVYDNGNRLSTLTDALQKSDQYQLDALGNTLIHTDRNQARWIYQPDRANRLVMETTPAITLTQVTSAVTNNQAALAYTQSSATIQKQTNYDSVGNEKSVIDGYGGNEPRILQYYYNACNKLQSTTIQNAVVDDVTKPASFTTPPVKPANLTTQFVYDAKQRKVAKQNNGGYWHFYIYDAADRLVYEVDEQNAVTYYERNVFGDVLQKTLYANPTALNISEYTQTGIPLAVIQQNITQSTSDQTVTYQVDQRGDTLLETHAAIFYYIANQAGPTFGTASPQTQKKFDAFRRCYYVGKLVDPTQNPPVWTQALTWFNRNGKPVAVCDELNRVKTYAYDAFSNQTQRNQYAKSPSPLPTVNTTLAALLASLQSDPTDRLYTIQYNLLQQKISKSIANQVVQQLGTNANNQQCLQNLPAQSLTKSYQYSATQKKIATTYEDGSTKYRYYDFRGSLIAEAGVPRQSQDLDKNTITIIPLTIYGYNSFAQQVLKCAYQSGTSQANINQLPVPSSTGSNDQYTLTLFDNRGLSTYQQDPEKNVTGFTFNATRKPAREYSLLTTWKPGNVSTVHMDEKRYQLDPVDNITLVTVLRDNATVQMTQAQFDMFRNVLAEGPGNDNWQIFYYYDTQNKCWKTNYKNATWTLQSTNLLGFPTGSIQSAVVDLSQITYTGLAALLENFDPTQLEMTSSEPDYAGRVLARNYPVFSQANLSSNIPLNLYVIAANGKTLITWTTPQETNFKQELTVTPSREPTKIIKLYIMYDPANKYCCADVSNLPTDTYTFSLLYKIHTPYPWLPEPSNYFFSAGTIQFDTGNTQGSSSLVAIVQSSNQLKLTGNTANLTAVQLCQGNTVVATIPVQLNSSQQAIVDLSSYPSGQYTINAFVNNNFTGLSSLPFTIYTATPAQTPLARQLDCSTQLLTLDTHVQLVWTVPADYAGLSVQMTCKYVGTDGNSYSYTGIAAPGVYSATYKDSNGNTLYCNAEFSQPIQSIQSLSLGLILDAQNTLLPLEIDLEPQASKTVSPQKQKPKVTELEEDWELISGEQSSQSKSVSLGNSTVIQSYPFPSRSVVYIAPINNPSAYSSITYFDTNLGSSASWKPYPIFGTVNPEGVQQSVLKNQERLARPSSATSLQTVAKPIVPLADNNNAAVRLFEGNRTAQSPSHLNFDTWYHPDICHYLLQMVENQAQCLRVMFDDAGYGNNTQTFRDQLQTLIVLANRLGKPAICISKEPGASNNFICSLIRGNDLIVINPLGITAHVDVYQTLAELQKAKIVDRIWFSNTKLQRGEYEESLVSCGPISLEIALHILKDFTLDRLNRLWDSLDTTKGIRHERTQLIYHALSIEGILLPKNIETLAKIRDERNYRQQVREIRQSHRELLAQLPHYHAQQAKKTVETYLSECREASPAQVLLNALITQHRDGASIHTMPEYPLLNEALSKPEKPIVLRKDLGINVHQNAETLRTQQVSMTRSHEHSLNPSSSRQSLVSNVVDAPGIVLDVTSMFVPGIYPCSIGELSTSFSVGDQGLLFNIGQGTNSNIAMQSRRVSQYDAWNNKTSDQDALKNVTNYTYTYKNRVASLLQPAVSAIGENGTATTLQPLTIYGYTQRGYLVGVCDANNHTQGYTLDAAGQQLNKILASGVIYNTQVFDALGRIPYYYDSRGKLTTNTFNGLNQVLTSTSPVGNVTSYLYDEQNHRRMQSLPGGLVYLYNYDPLNNLQQAYQPLGQLTTYNYDRNHLPSSQYNPDGSSQIWSRNYGGVKQKYTDIGGAEYSYYYDLKWQMTQETSVGGNHGTYLRYTTVDITKKGDIYYYFLFEPLPGKNVTYQYSAGHLMQVKDNVLGQVTQNFYDLNFAGIGQTVTIAGGTSRNVYSTLDALGREVLVYDSGATVTTGYDAVGNRRYVTLSAYDGYNNPPAPNVTINNWNIFDADDNVLTYNGILADGQVIITEGQGIQFTYQNNFRASQKTYGFTLSPQSRLQSYKLITTQLNYRDDGLLSTTSGSDGSQSTRTYTPASWLNSYVQTGGSTPGSFSTLYTANGWQYVINSSQNGKSGTTNFSNFTQTGLSQSQSSSYSNGLIVDLSSVSYVGFDSWQVSLMTGSTTYQGKTTLYTNSLDLYTSSGYPSWKLLEGNGAAFVTQYTPTPDGLITSQTTWTATQTLAEIIGDNTVCIEMNQIPTGSRYFYTVNGQPLGSVSGPTVAQVNYMPPVSDSYPPPVPGLYVVNVGDTFASIASAVYMDSSYANAIAAANKLSMNSPLSPGYTLILPQQLAMQNSIYTSVPYNQFVQTIIGSLQGQVVLPPKEHHESFLRTLAEIIVVGAVAMVTGGLGGALAGAALASEGLAAGMAVAAATGAITSAITQGIAIGFGMQESFSIKAMFISAVEAGLAEGFVGTGLMPNPMGGAQAISQFDTLELVCSNGLNNTMDQLMQMATGMQKQFDLRQLFSAMVVQTTTQELVVAGSTSAVLNSSGTNALQRLSVGVLNNQYGYQAVNDVNEVVLGDVIGNQHETVKQLSTEYLGTLAGQVLGYNALTQTPLSNVMDSLSRYTQAAQDSAAAANNSSNRYGFFSGGGSSNNATNNAANPSSSTTPVSSAANNSQSATPSTNGSSTASPSTTPAPTAASGVLSGGASNSQVNSIGQNASNFTSMLMPDTSITFNSAANLFSYGGLPTIDMGGDQSSSSFKSSFIDELTNIGNWLEETGGYVSDNNWVTKFQGLYQTSWNAALRAQAAAASLDPTLSYTSIGDIQEWQAQKTIAGYYFGLATKYGFFATGSNALTYAGKLANTWNWGDAVYQTYNAPANQRLEVGIEDFGGIVAGSIGNFIGGAIAAPVELVLPVASTPIVIASSVATGGLFSAAWKSGVVWAYSNIEETKSVYSTPQNAM